MSDEQNTQHAIRNTLYIPDLYFIFQHEKLGTFKAAQKLQDLYRAGELPTGLGDVSRLILTFDQRRALRYTARERIIAYRKVFGYSLFIRPTKGQVERNRSFHRLLVSFAAAMANDSTRSEAAANSLYTNLAPLLDHDLAPLSDELITPLNEAIRIFMSPELCAEFGAGSGWELVDLLLRRYFDEQNPQVLPRSCLADAGRILLRDLEKAPPEIAGIWLKSAGELDVLPVGGVLR